MIKLMNMHPKILRARFTIHIDLKILSGLEFDRAMIKVIKAGLATVIMITVGDYCSMTTGVLHYIYTHANEFSSESHSQGHCNYNTEIQTLIMNVKIHIITFYYCL